MLETFAGKHILSAGQFGPADLENVFKVARQMRDIVEKGERCQLLAGKTLTVLFYEASTRTSSSFISAMQRLGGQVIPITGIQYSSVSKGESLPDTVRTMEAYSDAIVMRHPTRGSAAEAASYLRIPLINAGDGDGEHPTQALLDLFTMFEELDDLNGRHIMLLGDLKYGRTVHALVQLLAHFKVRIDFVAPFSLSMPDEYLSLLTQKGIPFRQHVSPEEALGYMDVIYATRIQKERFVDQAEYERLKDVFVINAETMAKAKPGMVLMHPLPRVNEIAPEVDADPRAAYFRQVRNGLYVRMALLAMVLGKA